MSQNDEIIVLQRFDNAIDANIAKTKLDANEIPCFLTEENISNLYPVQHLNAFKVRLHVFQADRDQALSILNDYTEDEDKTDEAPWREF